MFVRLKVTCQEVVERRVGAGWYTKDKSGRLGELKFIAVTGGSTENDLFFNSTPTANIAFQATNVAILDEFEVGKEYYVTISAAVPVSESKTIFHHPV